MLLWWCMSWNPLPCLCMWRNLCDVVTCQIRLRTLESNDVASMSSRCHILCLILTNQWNHNSFHLCRWSSMGGDTLAVNDVNSSLRLDLDLPSLMRHKEMKYFQIAACLHIIPFDTSWRIVNDFLFLMTDSVCISVNLSRKSFYF